MASKTTDVNWTKAKDLGDHMGYYRTRSLHSRPNIQCIHLFRQFQWFNPSGKDYDKIAADRVARGEPLNYRWEKNALSYPHGPSLKRFHQNRFSISFSFLQSTIHMNSLLSPV